MYQQQYKMAMDRFSDVKHGIYGVVIKAEKGWRGSGRRAASSCNAFAIASFLVYQSTALSSRGFTV